MTPTPSPEALRQLLLRYQAAVELSRVHRAAGFDVAIADNIFGDVLVDFLRMLTGDVVHLVFLTPSPQVVARREAERAKIGYGPVWSIEALHRIVHESTLRLGWWIDTSELTLDETVDLLIAHPDRSRVVVDDALEVCGRPENA
jgi:chloramphenicol 3-O-phosphotransferase